MMNPISFRLGTLLMATAPAAGLLASVAVPPSGAGDPTLAALAAHEDPTLFGMRAGAPITTHALDAGELTDLQAAEVAAPDLQDLRAGEFSDRDLTIVVVIALVIIAVAILI